MDEKKKAAMNKTVVSSLALLGFGGGFAFATGSPSGSAEACDRYGGWDSCGCYCDTNPGAGSAVSCDPIDLGPCLTGCIDPDCGGGGGS
jgi:hypothetical protein